MTNKSKNPFKLPKGYFSFLEKEILIKEGKNYFDTNISSHHHFYDEANNELTDIENNRIELKKFPTPPKGKSIKDVNVIINIDNDNHNH